MSAAVHRLAAVVALLTLAGCGDPDLWARYRAERAYWRASRIIERIQLKPGVASDATYARATAALRAVTEVYPASRWVSPERLRSPIARDVATVSGRAAIALPMLDEMRGRIEPALAGYARVEQDYAPLLTVALEAALARAAALDRAGGGPAATDAYAAIARRYPMVDPENGGSLVAVMDAPLRVAADQARGGSAAAESTLGAAEAGYAAEWARHRGKPPAYDLAQRLAETLLRERRTERALSVLRRALGEPGADASATFLRIAEYAIAGGLPDSALVYAAWAERASDDAVRARGMILGARAWTKRGAPDSALAAWSRYLEAFPAAVDSSTMARFERGRLLEELGRWELARSEYRTLVALDPTNELAFEAMRRMVKWPASHGHLDEARNEAKQALDDLDRQIATSRDADVKRRARVARADLLMAAEEWSDACTALRDIWNQYGESALGSNAAFRAAALTEDRLHDGDRALELYRDLADHAALESDRRRAQEQIARLGRSRG